MLMSRKVRRLGSLGRGRTRDAVPPSSAVPFVVPAVPAAAPDERPELPRVFVWCATAPVGWVRHCMLGWARRQMCQGERDEMA